MKPRDPLSTLLHAWQPTPPPDPAFAAGVWARVHAPSGRSRLANVLHFSVALPLAASLAVMIGVGAAMSVNQRQSTEHWAAAYARSIDPLQMAAAPATPDSVQP